MSVDTETVAKIAALARIKLGDDELAAMVPDMVELWVAEMTKQGRGDEARAVAEQIKQLTK